MRLACLLAPVQLAVCAFGAAVSVDTPEATSTPALERAACSDDAVPTTTAAGLFKRYKMVHNGPPTTTTTATPPARWLLTVLETKVVMVTPTVIGGVTFSAKPPATTDGLEPWVLLKKDGTPKTIKPKGKNGRIQNKLPDYSTWFQQAVTKTHHRDTIHEHDLADDEHFEEVSYLPETDPYVGLNPIMRCTPDSYFKKGLAKDILLAPFCSPQENQHVMFGKVHFITWYTKHFGSDVGKVRIHLAFVSESARDRHMNQKRGWFGLGGEENEEGDAEVPEDDVAAAAGAGVAKSGSLKPAIVDHRGAKDQNGEFTPTGVAPAFFLSEWMLNRDGVYPLEVQEEWISNTHSYHKILIAVQPDNVPDDEFDLLTNSTKVNLSYGAIVGKTTKEHRRLEDEGPPAENAYYIAAALPTMVVILACGMYFLLWITRKSRDVSHLTKYRRKLSRFGNKRASELPQFEDIELSARLKNKLGKQA